MRLTLLAALLLLGGCAAPEAAGSTPSPPAAAASPVHTVTPQVVPTTKPDPSEVAGSMPQADPPEGARPTVRATAPAQVSLPVPSAPPNPTVQVPAKATLVSAAAPSVVIPTPLATTAPVLAPPVPTEADATVGPPTAPVFVPPEPATAPSAPGPTLRYVFPVQAAQVQYGASHHDYPATDIFCPIGSLFVAPTSGTIDFVSYEDRWDPAADDPALRGGLSVAMIGDDGVRYYGSHLSAISDAIAVGVRVEAGQTLGLTGKSGNARSTPAHLHFGISRPTTPDDWRVRRGEIAPFVYLQAWERGEALTPEL